MSDDRASFIKSQTQLTTELDALGATARGDTKGGYKQHNLDLDDDNDSWSSDSLRKPSHMPLPPSTANSGAYRDPPHSPIDPSVPLFPAGSRGPPPTYQDAPRAVYQADSRPTSDATLARSQAPTPYRDNASMSNLSVNRMQNNSTPTGFRNQHNASPWQRGAGYDH